MLALPLLIASLLPGVPYRERDLPDSSWVGKTVYVRTNAVRIDTAPEPVEQKLDANTGVLSNAISYRVFGERPNHVMVKTREGVLGWLRKADVVLLEDAGAVFSQQIELNPKDISGYNRRAAVWRAMGEYDAAIKDASEALRLSPQAVLFNNRALIWHAKKDHEKALADYAQAIALQPQNTLAYVNRTAVWQSLKEYDKAIADATQALQFQPKFPNAYRARGIAHHAKKAYDQAIADFNRALEIDSKSSQVHTDRAKAFAAKREHDKAHADFNAAVTIDPTNAAAAAEAALWLASCADAKYRDGKRAMELAQRARKLERNNAIVLQALAAAHAELGQYADAIGCQEHAMHDPQLRENTEAGRRLELYRKKQPLRTE